MTTLPQMRDLADRLVVYEAAASKASEPMESATLRVYEKLRGRLTALAGVAGFHSLACRALMQARSDLPGLWAVEVTADGSLQGLGESEPLVDTDNDSAGEVRVVLVARLLGLLLIFVGETLTLNVISDLWPDAALDDSIPRIGRKA